MRVGRRLRVTRRGNTMASNASQMMTTMQRAPAAAINERIAVWIRKCNRLPLKAEIEGGHRSSDEMRREKVVPMIDYAGTGSGACVIHLAAVAPIAPHAVQHLKRGQP